MMFNQAFSECKLFQDLKNLSRNLTTLPTTNLITFDEIIFKIVF